MARPDTTTDALRERLTVLLADWGAEMSMLLRELDEARKQAADQDSKTANHGRELKTLEDRNRGQAELIETLKNEASSAAELRSEVRAKDLEIERLASEIESKQELVRALRRDAESTDRLKAESKLKDKEIAGLYKDQRQAEKRIGEISTELESLRESAEHAGSHEKTELEAVRAELEARKTLIKSLRADADRVAALETRLEEKRDIVTKLEASINKHVETIAELKRSGEIWRKKYHDLRSRDPAATSMEIPALSQTDVAALQQLEQTDVAGAAPEHTIAIDMRRPLSEARRKAAQNQNK
jgi:predicted RNase H-like nuclease (RuvC/YqgF family)